MNALEELLYKEAIIKKAKRERRDPDGEYVRYMGSSYFVRITDGLVVKQLERKVESMGYTEFVLGITLKKNTPGIIIDILKCMSGAHIAIAIHNSWLTHHPLFNASGWKEMFRVRGGFIWIDRDISIRCKLNNYDSEIELFLNWIEPYVENRGFCGTIRHEDWENPKLIYHGLYDLDMFAVRDDVNGKGVEYIDDDWIKSNVHVVED